MVWWMPKIYLAVNIEELFSRFSCVVAGDSGLGKKTVLRKSVLRFALLYQPPY
jgi:hypothetical protein